MVTCGNCGAQVSIDGQRFCARCGVKLPETETQTTFLHAVQEPKVPPFCGQCGAKTSIEGQIFCLKCGARLLPTQQQTAPQSQQFQSVPQFTQTQPQPQYIYVQQPVQTFTPRGYVKTSRDSTLRLIAAIVNIVFCSLYGLYGVATLFASGSGFLFLICLAWMIPMTVYSWRLYTGERPNTTTFAVCTLIFVNLISGILLLGSDTDA